MSSSNQQDESYDEEQEDDEIETVQENGLKQLFKNQEQFMQQINYLNDQAVLKIKLQKFKEAMKLLQQSEQMLEYAASCGKTIDKNLIIVVLYNQACGYQCQWVLDKCSKYLSGVIYNMEECMKEEEQETNNLASTQESDASLVKSKAFLARTLLQHTAILSQLGKHKLALQSARKAASTMREVFKIASQFCKDWLNKNGSLGSATTANSSLTTKSKQKNNKFQMKDEVEFSRLVIDASKDILQDLSKQQDLDNISNNEQLILREAKKQLYFWRTNPENNEKHIRKELKLDQKEDDYRSILGVQNVQEWIQTFNIGFIMHMTPQIYKDFSSQGEMLYEISKRLLLEKIIYLSISYFTIATELRFIELDKAKQQGIKDINTDEFKLSELYHLKAVEIACKNITCSSPYINHLITSYHKHYNSNLDTIQEESMMSMVSEVNYKEQKLLKLKQMQIQTQRENQSILKNLAEIKLNDSSPSGKFVNSFLNQQSPLKTNRNISDNVKPQTSLMEQMIINKRRQQMPSDMSPKQKVQFFNATSNNSCERINEKLLKTQETLPIQLQPYKSAKTTFNNLIKQTQNSQASSNQNNNGLLKAFFFDNCRTERMNASSNQSPRRVGRSPEKSPDRSQISLKPRNSVLGNKTPQNRPRTDTEQQCHIKFETIQQLLRGQYGTNQKRK
ncbi:unnamed protein product [Paramecium octaurelia]|uniref:Uncharacterized protein n=1 Tax=Paramecium octaurelia TaxID=43137 RepID=A0A8S1V1T2_PAROT|nr:unnamed protein product [Paramecium octaurelia]